MDVIVEQVEGWPGPVHPAANIFPLMQGDDFAALVDDVKANGLLEPVWLTAAGELLDGRNRARACAAANVPIATKVYTGADPIGFAVSLNMKRRHLTTGQKAAVAADLEKVYAAEGLRRMAAGGAASAPGRPAEKGQADLPDLSDKAWQARDQAASVVGTSGRAVSRFKRVQETAPELAEKVRGGHVALDRAERIVRDLEAAERRASEAVAQQQNIQIGTLVDLRHGDFREVMADLTDVDAIITDPPYPRDYLPLLDDLRDWSDQVLAPDGVLVILFGQTFLPEVYQRLQGGRPYRWTGCYLTPGAGYSSMRCGVQSNWKPILVYGGGDRFADVFRSEGTDAAAKSLHHWGQDYGAFHQIVDRITKPGHTVVDPFMGSGTTLLAAKALGRHAIGCDINADHVAVARKRLGA
jgi:hypothetical protein